MSLDGKGRITVPVRHRQNLQDQSQGQITFTRHPDGYLLLFPRPIWVTFRTKLMTLPMQADGWRRLFLGSAVDLEIDSADRVLVPPELRNSAGLTKDLRLIGNGNRLELWDAVKQAEHEVKVLAAPIPESIQGFVF